MEIEVTDAELDFGTLVIRPSRDDDITLVASGRGAELRIALFNHEARELIDVLTPLANAESQ